jgi:hypothetical protein
METAIQQLKDEVSTLEAWLGLRDEQLRLALAQQENLLRILTVRLLPPEDLEAERRKEAAIREELDSLRESRQALEGKKSLLYRLESQLKYQEADRRIAS